MEPGKRLGRSSIVSMSTYVLVRSGCENADDLHAPQVLVRVETT
jgi:hypothetical protein